MYPNVNECGSCGLPNLPYKQSERKVESICESCSLTMDVSEDFIPSEYDIED